MSAILTRSRIEFGSPRRIESPQREAFPEAQDPAAGSRFAALLRTALRCVVAVALGVAALTVLLVSLVPPVFVALLVFLPALLPLLVSALGIVLSEDGNAIIEPTAEADGRPCSCHLDRFPGVLSNG